MTRKKQIQEWLDSTPVVRLCVNKEIVELTGEDRRPHFETIYDEGIENYTAAEAARSRTVARSSLRAAWDALPDFIRGPFRDKFEAANRLLDEGDDDAAIELIEYAEAPASFDATQLATFAATQAAMKAGIENLTQAP